MNRIAKLKRPSAARDDCGNHAARYAGAFFELRNVIIFIDLLLFRIYVDKNYLFDI